MATKAPLTMCPSPAMIAVLMWGSAMSVDVEALFTSALGLKSPWQIVEVELDIAKRKTDFEVA